MHKVTLLSERKADHIRINLEEDVRSGLTTGLEDYFFTHRALPEMNLEDVDLSLKIFGRQLQTPLLISSMTGGTSQATAINRTLAQAAQEAGVALGLGSQRAAIQQPELAETFQVRRDAPDILLFANLGAVQLNYGYSLEHCQRAVDMVEADALFLHLNPLQEAVQPEGDTRFAGLLQKIERLCRTLPVPVVIKEVGWGIAEQDARRLAEAGVAAIDVAGAGGTSWSQVEMRRAQTESQANLAAAFKFWGIPTAESILNVRRGAPQLPVFASGGLRDGVEIAKCIALGATLGGMAAPFLKAVGSAVGSAAGSGQALEKTIETIAEIRRELQVCMFAAGARNLEQLRQIQLGHRAK